MKSKIEQQWELRQKKSFWEIWGCRKDRYPKPCLYCVEHHIFEFSVIVRDITFTKFVCICCGKGICNNLFTKEPHMCIYCTRNNYWSDRRICIHDKPEWDIGDSYSNYIDLFQEFVKYLILEKIINA